MHAGPHQAIDLMHDPDGPVDSPVQLPISHRWRSPNFTERRGTDRPDMVVLHYTAMESCEAAAERLCDPQFEVSAHYLIAENGDIHQLVDEMARAWHAGRGSWGNVTDVNSHSIGIELANTGFHPFPEPQMAALETLLADILRRHDIAPERVIGHSDMAPGRKSDPGSRFDWKRLAHKHLSVWPTDAPTNTPLSSFPNLATCFGYPNDAAQDDILNAFRLRFRPNASGPLAKQDVAILASLVARYPIDPPAGDA